MNNRKMTRREALRNLGLLAAGTFAFSTSMLACGSQPKSKENDTTTPLPVGALAAIPAVPVATLSNGVKLPRLGLGTFLQPSNDVAKQSVLAALKAGYRHIDTAHAYNDEEGVGQGIKESGVPRKEICLVSKLWVSDYGANGKTLKAIDEMLGRLQTDYIDILYVHQPVGEVLAAWKEMEQAYKQGKVKALGISNFDYPDPECEALFEEIMKNSEIKPVVMQVECHPYAQRLDVKAKIAPYNLQLECWYPLGGKWSNGLILKDEVINKIGQVHGKSAAQIILRWHMQEGHSAIPGSTNPAHIQENIDIFDFELSDEEMAQMRALNKEQRLYNATYQQTKGFANGPAM
jgi:diketogulonate reductase-like aldo/keto reductase